ncbi:MAG TPA: hypothetical protein VJ861_13150 [Treponemataceae bacterium]|nr:hypothetical protein [Treponemataceae bacterium]
MKIMEHLEELLIKEITVITNLISCQKRMYQAVVQRDWILFQKELMFSGKMTETFTALEQLRLSLLAETKIEAELSTDFYRSTACLPEERRLRANELYRELKKLLLLSQSENRVLQAYVSNARSVVSGIVDTLVPVRRNKIYSKRGSLVSTNIESLVLNRSF